MVLGDVSFSCHGILKLVRWEEGQQSNLALFLGKFKFQPQKTIASLRCVFN